MSLQVMFLVAFIACILKKPALDEEDTNEDLNNVIAAHDEEFIGKDNGTIEGLTLNQYNREIHSVECHVSNKYIVVVLIHLLLQKLLQNVKRQTQNSNHQIPQRWRRRDNNVL